MQEVKIVFITDYQPRYGPGGHKKGEKLKCSQETADLYVRWGVAEIKAK